MPAEAAPHETSVSLFEKLKGNRENIVKLLPITSFLVPFLLLYLMQDAAYPSYTFEAAWKGRMFYLFFLWFAVLEIIVFWEKLNPKAFRNLKSARTVALVSAFSIPTLYIIISSFYGVNMVIREWFMENCKGCLADWMPLSIEYLVLAAAAILIIFLQYGVEGLRLLPLAPTFLAAIGAIYTIDNLYPYGQFMLFQLPSAATTVLAQSVLNLMGYSTSISYIQSSSFGWVPFLKVSDPQNPLLYTRLGVAWPCSGVESLLIYTLFMVLFLRNFEASRTRKAGYFIIGAIITYLINIVRIVSLCIIALKFGPNSINPFQSQEFQNFHSLYGQLYSITWISLYPILLMTAGDICRRIRILMKTLKPRAFSQQTEG